MKEINRCQEACSCKILVAEDELALRRLFVLSLKMGGFEIIEASHGLDAVEKAILEKPSVVLLDNRMPGLTGPEVIDVLRKKEFTGYFVLVTASHEARHLAESHGFDEYLEKPVVPSQLIELARRACHAISAKCEVGAIHHSAG